MENEEGFIDLLHINCYQPADTDKTQDLCTTTGIDATKTDTENVHNTYIHCDTNCLSPQHKICRTTTPDPKEAHVFLVQQKAAPQLDMGTTPRSGVPPTPGAQPFTDKIKRFLVIIASVHCLIHPPPPFPHGAC